MSYSFTGMWGGWISVYIFYTHCVAPFREGDFIKAASSLLLQAWQQENGATEFSQPKESRMALKAETFPLPEPNEDRPIVSSKEAIPITGMPLHREIATLEMDGKLEIDDEARVPWLTETAREVGAACGNAIGYAASLVDQARERVRKVAADVQERATRVKDEQPLTILAVAAGIAVVAGVMARVWRSNRYE